MSQFISTLKDKISLPVVCPSVVWQSLGAATRVRKAKCPSARNISKRESKGTPRRRRRRRCRCGRRRRRRRMLCCRCWRCRHCWRRLWGRSTPSSSRPRPLQDSLLCDAWGRERLCSCQPNFIFPATANTAAAEGSSFFCEDDDDEATALSKGPPSSWLQKRQPWKTQRRPQKFDSLPKTSAGRKHLAPLGRLLLD
jgi:hypothetical protein